MLVQLTAVRFDSTIADIRGNSPIGPIRSVDRMACLRRNRVADFSGTRDHNKDHLKV